MELSNHWYFGTPKELTMWNLQNTASFSQAVFTIALIVGPDKNLGLAFTKELSSKKSTP